MNHLDFKAIEFLDKPENHRIQEEREFEVRALLRVIEDHLPEDCAHPIEWLTHALNYNAMIKDRLADLWKSTNP